MNLKHWLRITWVNSKCSFSKHNGPYFRIKRGFSLNLRFTKTVFKLNTILAPIRSIVVKQFFENLVKNKHVLKPNLNTISA